MKRQTVRLKTASVILALGMLLTACGPKPVTLGRYRAVADFQLTDRTGRPVNRKDLEGRIVVVDFFFASCAEQCLVLGQRMAEVHRLLGGADDVRLLSLTVDPRSDTPQALARYAPRFTDDTNRWWFVTGDKPALYDLIQQSFLLPAGEREDERANFSNGFIHSDKIALVDAHGVVRAYFDGLAGNTPQRIVEAIDKLRHEPQPN